MTAPLHFPALPGNPSCKPADADLFFPEAGHPTKRAKAICAGCEVRDQCLAWALRYDEPHGVWGGKSAVERQGMRPKKSTQRGPKRGPINHGTEAGYQQHRRRDETPCNSCREASRVATAERVARRKAS